MTYIAVAAEGDGKLQGKKKKWMSQNSSYKLSGFSVNMSAFTLQGELDMWS